MCFFILEESDDSYENLRRLCKFTTLTVAFAGYDRVPSSFRNRPKSLHLVDPYMYQHLYMVIGVTQLKCLTVIQMKLQDISTLLNKVPAMKKLLIIKIEKETNVEGLIMLLGSKLFTNKRKLTLNLGSDEVR